MTMTKTKLLFLGLSLFISMAQTTTAINSLADTVLRSKTTKQILSSTVLYQGLMSAAGDADHAQQDPLESALTEIYGHKVATLGTTGLAMSLGQPIEKAIGMAYGVGAFGVLSLLVRGFPRKFGFTTAGLILELGVHLLAAAILLLPEKIALPIQIVQGIACFGLMNGLVGMLKPVTFAGAWGLSATDSRRLAIQRVTRGVAIGIAASCVTTLLLLGNYDVDSSIVYGCSGFLLIDLINASYNK
jgi:hypothetical protein